MGQKLWVICMEKIEENKQGLAGKIWSNLTHLINIFLGLKYLLASLWVLLNMRGEALSFSGKVGIDWSEKVNIFALSLLILSLILLFAIVFSFFQKKYSQKIIILTILCFAALNFFESYQHVIHGTMDINSPGLYIWGFILLFWAGLNWRKKVQDR